MHSNVKIQVFGGRTAEVRMTQIVDDDQTKDLRVWHDGEHGKDNRHGFPRFAKRQSLEGKKDGDEALHGDTENQPRAHQVAHVRGEVVELARGVAEFIEDPRASPHDHPAVYPFKAFP